MAQLIGKMVVVPLGVRLRASKKFKPIWISKSFNSIGKSSIFLLTFRRLTGPVSTFSGTLASATFLIATGYMTCKQIPNAITFCIFACFFYSFQGGGISNSLASIAPAYAGIVSSLARFCADIGAMLTPYAVSLLTVDVSSLDFYFN